MLIVKKLVLLLIAVVVVVGGIMFVQKSWEEINTPFAQGVSGKTCYPEFKHDGPVVSQVAGYAKDAVTSTVCATRNVKQLVAPNKPTTSKNKKG